MKIRSLGSEVWSRDVVCRGGVHNNWGCGSSLTIGTTDLFYTYNYGMSPPEKFVAFQCGACGLGNILAKEGTPGWNRWFDNIYKANPCVFQGKTIELHQYEQLEALNKQLASFVAWFKRSSKSDRLAVARPVKQDASKLNKRRPKKLSDAATDREERELGKTVVSILYPDDGSRESVWERERDNEMDVHSDNGWKRVGRFIRRLLAEGKPLSQVNLSELFSDLERKS